MHASLVQLAGATLTTLSRRCNGCVTTCTGRRCGATCSGCCGDRRRRRRTGGRCWLRSSSRCHRRPCATTKISHIPACSFELKAGRSHLFFECVFLTRRTIRQRWVGHFLQHIFGKTTGFAAIRVNRHDETPQESYKTQDYKGFPVAYMPSTMVCGAIANSSRHLTDKLLQLRTSG